MWILHDGTGLTLCCLAHSSLNHIQRWTTVRESYSCTSEQGPLTSMRQRPIRTRKAAPRRQRLQRLRRPPSRAKFHLHSSCSLRHFCCGTGGGAIINLSQNSVAFSTRLSMRRNSPHFCFSRLCQRRAKRLQNLRRGKCLWCKTHRVR